MVLPKVNVPVKTQYASKYSYDVEYRKKSNENIYIIVHGTANDGDTAAGNANYFADVNRRYAGAQVFVDDNYCYKSVPISRAAWAVGGKMYTGTGQGAGRLYQKCTNYNSINIEMCDTIKDGVVDISEKTLENTASVVAYYAVKYHIPMDHIARHWDVNGKPCPSYMIGNGNALWNHFLERVKFYIDSV